MRSPIDSDGLEAVEDHARVEVDVAREALKVAVLVEIFRHGAIGEPVGVPRPVVNATIWQPPATMPDHLLDVVARACP